MIGTLDGAQSNFMHRIANMKSTYIDSNMPMIVTNNTTEPTHTSSITGIRLSFTEVLHTKNKTNEKSSTVIRGDTGFNIAITDKQEDCVIVVSLNDMVVAAQAMKTEDINGCKIAIDTDITDIVHRYNKDTTLTISIYSDHPGIARHLHYSIQ